MLASDFAAQRIREIRTSRGWTAKDLAERCATIGAPEITAAVIANIETGRRDKQGRRRRDITVDEILTFAYALEVPPVLLFIPLDGADSLMISPAVKMDATTAAAWAEGDDLILGDSVYGEPLPVAEDDRKRRLRRFHTARPLSALRNAWMWLYLIQRLEEPGIAAAAAALAGAEEADAEQARDETFKTAIRAVAGLVDILSGRGLTPPPLPRKVVEALRDGSLLEHPLDYPGELLVSDEEG
jgi:transcriptional regulator with XRE-family HTH domain